MVPQPGPKEWGTAVFRTRDLANVQNLEFSPAPIANNISSIRCTQHLDTSDQSFCFVSVPIP